MTCKEHRVRVTNIVERRVTLDNRQVARINNNRPQTNVNPVVRRTVVNDARNVVAPTRQESQVNVGTPGIPGRNGRDGTGSIPAIGFSFGDPAHSIFVTPAAGTLTYARVKFDTVFNGVGAAFALGTLATPDLFLQPEYNDPTQAQEYENTPDVHLAAGVAIIVTVTPGTGGTTGAGRIFLEFIPD